MMLTKVSPEEIQQAEERAQKIRAEKEQYRKKQSNYFTDKIAKQKEQQKQIEKNYKPLIDTISNADYIKINSIPKIVEFELSENAEGKCISVGFYKQDSKKGFIEDKTLEIVEYVPAKDDTRIPFVLSLYETKDKETQKEIWSTHTGKHDENSLSGAVSGVYILDLILNRIKELKISSDYSKGTINLLKKKFFSYAHEEDGALVWVPRPVLSK